MDLQLDSVTWPPMRKTNLWQRSARWALDIPVISVIVITGPIRRVRNPSYPYLFIRPFIGVIATLITSRGPTLWALSQDFLHIENMLGQGRVFSPQL